MKWSFKVANILGIDLKIHISFFLILILGAMQWKSFGPGGMAFGIVLMSLLFLCVTLHEFGHSVVAQRLGITVREIILLPIGGVAMLSRNPDKPVQELLIAVAGPAVNIVIGAAIAIYLGLYSIVNHLNLVGLIHAASAGPSWQALLVWLLNANIMLVVFNMIPAFPLDGGRVFRALLGFFMSWRRATSIATSVGQFLAIGLGMLAIFAGQIFLGIIAILLFMAAGATRADENARTFLSTRKIGDIYNKHALVLDESDHVSRVVDYLLTSYQPDFAVIRQGEFLGVVSREQVLHSLANSPLDEPVWSVMVRTVPHVQSGLTIDDVRQIMAEQQSRVVAVFDHDTYLGLVNSDDLPEALMLITYEQRHQEIQQPIAAPAPAPLPEPGSYRSVPAWPGAK